ncbi:hypothetical protein E1180_07410 [Roseibium denhamense]|nr:hypothetical protein [Roseibium denhamense]
MAVQIVLFLAGIWCMTKFFAATDALPAVKWGITSSTLLLMAMNLKLSLWPQMQADRILRELKRVELMLLSRKQ